MNKRMIAYVQGLLLLCEAGLLLLPLAVAFIYGDKTVSDFLLTIGILLLAGGALALLKPKDKTIYARDGLAIVALGWIILSLFGALPFYLSGEIPRYFDALFETVSGFTTTGSSILTDVEVLSKSLLFWRSFTQWIGGMGVLVFVMAVLPLAGGGGNLHLMRAEAPGPNVGKLVPKSYQSAQILYMIYLILTLLLVIMLMLGGLPLFDSITTAFATAGTGGFGTVNTSVADYSTYCQVVIGIFMALFGINFNFYFLLIYKRFKEALRSTELWAYLGFMGGSIALITLNIYTQFESVGKALHHAAFQVSSVMTTTAFSTVEFDKWPEFSRMILLMLMCIGACAGSTGGGFKLSRIIILLKNLHNELRTISHPRSIKVIKFDGRRIYDETVRSTVAFFTLYVFVFLVSLLIVSADRTDMVSNISAVVAELNNIGRTMGVHGANGDFSSFSDLSRFVFIIDMLLGRLELFPLICLFMPPRNKAKLTLFGKELRKK